MTRTTYLDHNATTPLRPEAAAVMAEALASTGNASSVHRFGRQARRTIETAREAVARLAGARPEAVIFTSGGTEANNLALAGCGRTRLLVSAGEHDSVLNAAPDAARIPLTEAGLVAPAALDNLLGESDVPALVSIMLANNETGAIQPLAELAEVARAHGALVHCDAVQAAGKLTLDLTALGIDLMSLSAHKLGGPQGVGALVLARDLAANVELAPFQRGGGQERGRRAGTENVPGIAGFGAAAQAALADLDRAAALAPLRDDLERRLHRLAPGIRFFATAAPRLPNTSCFAAPGLTAETQVIALDLAGVAVSAGSACSSGKVAPSHVLAAMGASAADAAAAIRVSLGWTSEAADIERFLEAWGALYSRGAGNGQTARAANPAA
jgi:cysteine desulfurase